MKNIYVKGFSHLRRRRLRKISPAWLIFHGNERESTGGVSRTWQRHPEMTMEFEVDSEELIRLGQPKNYLCRIIWAFKSMKLIGPRQPKNYSRRTMLHRHQKAGSKRMSRLLRLGVFSCFFLIQQFLISLQLSNILIE